MNVERVEPWVLRAVWVLAGILGAGAIDAATAGRGDGVVGTATWGGAALWVAGVAAMAIPSVVSLTATRAIVPLSVPAAAIAWIGGAGAVEGAAFLAAALVASILALNGVTGRAFVQASAYGAEDRYLLRPPAAYALAAVATWLVWAAALLAGPLLLADRRWIAGAVLTAIAAGGAVWAWPRWHRLARRWFVVVPAGVVIHDDLVLGETLMLPRRQVAAMHLALAGTEAADLTGPASGHALEIVTTESITAVYAPTLREPRGRAIHLTACLVAPTRPGQALAAVTDRHHDVRVTLSSSEGN